jgi:hypothetical protein
MFRGAPDLLPVPYFTREEADEQRGLDGYKVDAFSATCDYDDFVDVSLVWSLRMPM